MNKFDLGGLSDSCGSPQNLRLLAGYRLPIGKHGGYYNGFSNKSQEKNGKKTREVSKK